MSGQLVLAADVGGTQMRAALVETTGKIVVRQSAETPADEHVPGMLIDLIRSVGEQRADGELSHAVVGLPGGVDYDAGHLLWAPHLPEGWPDQLSQHQLASRLGLDVHVANDADLAAVGEARFGAGTGVADVVYITISTGIGAGVVQGGRLVHGHRSLAEVGHTVIDVAAWHARLPSTLEELGSGSGIARQAVEAGLGTMDARAVAAAASAGDERAQAIWQKAIQACAAGVANLIMAFSPSLVVIGGGLGQQESLFGPMRHLALKRAEHYPPDLAIVPTALGDDAGLVGAAAWLFAVEP